MERLLNRFVGNISPAALLVSTFFWSWFDVVPFGAAIFQGVGGSVELAPMIVSLGVSVLALGAVAVRSPLGAQLLRTRSFAVLSLVCGTGGAVLLFLGSAAQSSPMLLAAGVLIGLYEAAGIMVSGSIVTCQGTTNALIHIAVALPMNIVPILLIAFLEPTAALVLACLLPLLSALSFAVFNVRQGSREALQSVLSPGRARKQRAEGGPSSFLRANGNFLAMVLVVTIAFGMVNVRDMVSAGQSPFDEYIGLFIRAAVSAVVLFGYLRYSWRPQTIFTAAMVFMAVSLIAAAVVEGPLPSWVFFTGYICFDLLIWAIIIALSYQSGKALLQTICLVQAVDQGGIFAGTLLAAIEGVESSLALIFAALGVATMLLVMGLLVRNRSLIEKLSHTDFEMVTEDDAPAVDLPASESSLLTEPAGVSEAAVALEQSLSEVAGRYFLSAREVDILSLLLAGRSGPYIADHLCISANTVKTHIRHIYTKLDVHDRQELIDLVRTMEN